VIILAMCVLVTEYCTRICVMYTQPLTEMSTRNIKIIMFPGSKVRPVRRADNLIANCEPIVYTMWDP
jgi:hypothetical protein